MKRTRRTVRVIPEEQAWTLSRKEVNDTGSITSALNAYKLTGYLMLNKVMVRALGLVQAAVLSDYVDRFIYYFERYPENRGWFYRTHEKMAEELNLPLNTVKRMKQELIQRGLLRSQTMGIPAREWLTIDFDQLDSFMAQVVQSRQGILPPKGLEPKGAKGLEPKGAKGLDPKGAKGLERYGGRGVYKETISKGEHQLGNETISPDLSVGRDHTPPALRADVRDSDDDNGSYRSKTKRSHPTIKERREALLPLAERLASIIREHKNVKVDRPKLTKWADEIRKLVESDGVHRDRIEHALDWYSGHIGGAYIPVIESGASLRQKFLRLEDAMRRHGDLNDSSSHNESTPQTEPHQTPRSIINGHFRHREEADAFSESCYRPARSLFQPSTSAEKAELVQTLIRFYADIDAAQEHSPHRSRLPGPMDVIENYLEWIADQDWLNDRSPRLLDSNHTLFKRFRRVMASNDNMERDPVTGRSYMDG